MPVSENYLKFKRQLEKMQSKARITTSVSAALARAQNLPATAQVNVPTLVQRVAQHQGLVLTPGESKKAGTLVRRALQSSPS